MTRSLYNKAKEGFLSGDISVSTGDVKVILINTSYYAVDLTNHQYLSEVSTAARVATSTALSNATVSSGVFDANDITFSAVSGTTVRAVLGYVDTASSSTSPLVWYADDYTGLPFSPTGADITIAWAATTDKIFAL